MKITRHFAYLSFVSLVDLSMLLRLLSHFSSVWLCVTPSLGFSRQEHWSGLPFPSPMHKSEKWKWSRSAMSDSSQPHGLQPTRLLCPWDFSRQEYWSGVPLLFPDLSMRVCLLFIWNVVLPMAVRTKSFPLEPWLLEHFENIHTVEIVLSLPSIISPLVMHHVLPG